MIVKEYSTEAMHCGVRIRSMGFSLPGIPIELDSIDLTSDMRKLLNDTGQKFTYCSEVGSTDLAVAAAQEAMDKADLTSSDIGMVISAPTLLTSYGFEIPAISIRAALNLELADCLNVAQGCVGVLAGLRLAAQFLRCEPSRGDVLVVTACRASSLVEKYTHGAFFWGDAAGAVIVTADPGKGLHVEAYAEKSSNTNWGAMRLRHGDTTPFADCVPKNDLKIDVHFTDQRAQADYILGEQERCSALINSLLAAGNLTEQDLEALFFPSIGKNRIPVLLSDHRSLEAIVGSDFRYAHMGGVDVMLFLDQYIDVNPPTEKSWYLAMTPAFTAQWGGVLLRYDT